MLTTDTARPAPAPTVPGHHCDSEFLTIGVPTKRFSAVMVRDGLIRRFTYDAADETDARDIARSLGLGYVGPAPEEVTVIKNAEPEAYSLADAQRLLGGVSRATIYRWLKDASLERIGGTRRVLITRKSILKRAARVAACNARDHVFVRRLLNERFPLFWNRE